jgi:hypothetical protein
VRPARAIALALLLAALAGCSEPRARIVDFSEAQRDYRSKDYQDVYGIWTRHNLVRYEYVDAALEAWVTFKSWDYREAYVEHYAAVYGLSDADRSALRAAQLESFRDAYEFHVAAQSNSYKWNDLEKKSSAWRVTLVDGVGHELTPEFVHLEKLPDAYEIEFFPAKNPFTRSYLVRFPKAPPAADAGESAFLGPRTGSLTLRIASPLGRVDFVWQGN